MCAHAPAAADITRYLTEKLYPTLGSKLDLARARYGEYHPNAVPQAFVDLLYSLKKEFDSLRNYESKLVFPTVLRVFDTKDAPVQEQPKANIDELQRLTQNKERVIADLVGELERRVCVMDLSSGDPLDSLLHAFRTEFIAGKREWHGMLNRWKTGCACFAAANDASIPPTEIK